MKIIKLTQSKYALVDDSDYEYLNQWKWHCKNNNYAVRHDKFLNKKIVFMHRIIMNPGEGMQVDHINGDTLDNRRKNLRVCTPQQNYHNRKIQSNNKTGYKGVRSKTGYEKYIVEIKVDGKIIYLGYVEDPIEGARLYNTAAKMYYGEFARLNIIPEEKLN